MYEAMAGRGDTAVCFFGIMPDPTLLTYMVGDTILGADRRMEAGIERVQGAVTHQG